MTMNPGRVSKSHMPALDGVRGLAVILVVLFAHYSSVLSGSVPLERRIAVVSAHVGLTGVDLFFVLSGFLITGILLDTRDSPSYFRSFYARRILRIFPLYYAYLFINFFPLRGINLQLEKVDKFAAINPYWYLAYLSNLSPTEGVSDYTLGHFWSLAIEEQFYLAWPLVLFLVPRRSLAPICLAGIGAAILLRFELAIGGAGTETLHRFTPGRMDTLLLGALAAIAFRDDGQKALWSRLIRPVAVASGLVFTAVVAVSVYLKPSFSFFYTLGSSAIAAFYACLVFWGSPLGTE
jgi:peptidoglycan/LPS O-acetylase OafA/YrhL